MNWRLVSEVSAVVSDTESKIWLFTTEKGSRKLIRSLLSVCSSYREVQLADGDSLEVNFLGEDCPSVKFQELGNKFYTLENYRGEFLKDMIAHSTVINGYLKERVNPVFSREAEKEVALVHEGMEAYKECYNEMVKEMLLKSSRKTKKWVPGHKYVTETSVFYYLGSFNSHRVNDKDSEYVDSLDKSKAYLYVSDLKGCKTISEVFKTQKYGKEIKAFYNNLPSAVECGEVLTSDLKRVETLWDDMIKNSTGLVDLLDIFCYRSDNVDSIPVGVEKLIIDRMKDQYFRCLLRLEGICHDIKSNFWINTDPRNISSRDYYTGLMTVIGIDCKKVFSEVDASVNEYGSARGKMSSSGVDFILDYIDDYYAVRQGLLGVSGLFKVTERPMSSKRRGVRTNAFLLKKEHTQLRQIAYEMANKILKTENENGLACIYETFTVLKKGKRVSFRYFEITARKLVEYARSESGLSKEVEKSIKKLLPQKFVFEIDDNLTEFTLLT